MTDSGRIAGTVKWFSNEKGYGFITPNEGSSITEDIFVHQSCIHSEGYRTLNDEWQVEFEVGHDEDGKPKAENVTAPGGGPCTGPRKPRNTARSRRRRQPRYNDEETNDNNDAMDMNHEMQPNTHTHDEGSSSSTPAVPRRQRVRAERPPPQPMWHDTLIEDVKLALKDKNIRTTTGTIDISFEKLRLKLGTRNYASLAHEDKILAEGSFECDCDGHATFEWKRAIQYTDDWNNFLDLSVLVQEINLVDERVKAVGVGENMHTLMGEEVADPRNTLAASGFEMRRVVLTPKRR